MGRSETITPQNNLRTNAGQNQASCYSVATQGCFMGTATTIRSFQYPLSSLARLGHGDPPPRVGTVQEKSVFQQRYWQQEG